MTAKIVTKTVAKKAEDPSVPKITGLLVRDPLSVPRAIKSRPGMIWQRPEKGGVAVFFHENPATSHLPHPVGSKDFRRMLDEIKLDEYEGAAKKVEEPAPEKEPEKEPTSEE